MAHLINYQTFPTLQDAAGLIELLEKHQIPYKIDDSSMRFGLLGNDNLLETGTVIKIQASDIEKLKEIDVNVPTEFTANHYLYTFSDNDIIDVVVNPEEWTDEEIELAREIAAQRNLQFTAEAVKSTRTRQEQMAAKKEKKVDIEARDALRLGAPAWFLWIAIFSIVNITAFAFGQHVNFLLGLGINFAVLGAFGAAGEELGRNLMLYAYVLAYLFSALFIWFWYKSKRGSRAVYFTGMIIYVIDTLLLVVARDWWSVGVHLFALLFLHFGYMALVEYKKAEKQELNN